MISTSSWHARAPAAVRDRDLPLPLRRSNSFIQIPLQGSSHLAPCPMQKDPLVGLGDAEDVTDLGRRPAFDVPKGDDLSLAGRKRVDGRTHAGERLARQEALLRGSLPPTGRI